MKITPNALKFDLDSSLVDIDHLNKLIQDEKSNRLELLKKVERLHKRCADTMMYIAALIAIEDSID